MEKLMKTFQDGQYPYPLMGAVWQLGLLIITELELMQVM